MLAQDRTLAQRVWTRSYERLFAQQVRVSALGVVIDAGAVLKLIPSLPQFDDFARRYSDLVSSDRSADRERRQQGLPSSLRVAQSLQDHFAHEGARGGAAAVLVLAHACVDVCMTELVVAGIAADPQAWRACFVSLKAEGDKRMKGLRALEKAPDAETAMRKASYVALGTKKRILEAVGIDGWRVEFGPRPTSPSLWEEVEQLRRDAIHSDFLGEEFDKGRELLPAFMSSAMAYCLNLEQRYSLAEGAEA